MRETLFGTTTGAWSAITKKIASKINALLEIGLEEVPARFMPGLLSDLKEKAIKEIQASRLKFDKIATYGTPRRLVLYIEGLPIKQDDLSKEVKGPPRDAAFTNNGTPSKSAEGFAASQGVSISALKIKKIGNKEFVFAQVKEKGLETQAILKDIFPKIIRSLYLPISMRWSNIDFRFIRTIQWIFAVCGSSVVDFSLANVRSSDKTYGHRYYGSKPIKMNIAKGIELKSFMQTLGKSHVMLDQDERRKKILNMAESAAKKLGGILLFDKELLEEVNYLVECPEVLSGKFKKEYLGLPKDVLVTSMKKNQKYFSVIDASDKLLPFFVNIADGTAKSDLNNVAEGNERVLTARLNDAKFFFDEDRKKFMGDLVPGLKKVAFYEKLGSMFEKVERITKLSEWIANELKLPESKKENIKEIAVVCKADLLTQMVYEFPVLQGVMGREYLLLEGRPKEIANGIYEHYLPRHAEDRLPSSAEGSVVGIADKIDSIVGCFSINLIPSGSEDPYGLRRQAHGIVSILLKMKMDLELDLLIERAYRLYEPLFLGEIFASGKVKYNEMQKVIPDVLSFLGARLKGILLDEKVRYDVADAVISNFEDVIEAYNKARTISKVIKEKWLEGIIITMDRVKRLAVNAKRGNVMESDFVLNEEKSLYELYMKVNSELIQSINQGDYDSALKALSNMTKPVDDFFVKVMVMDENEKLKANRLALLKTLEGMYLEFADFTKIIIAGE